MSLKVKSQVKYTVLPYLESTGTQYIDTGFVPNQDTRVYAECVLPIASSTQGLFGVRVSSSSRQYQFVTQGGYYRTDYNTTINNFTTHDYGTNKFYIDKNKNITDLNGEYGYEHTYATFTCPYNMYVFATNNNGVVYANAVAKLYCMKIYDNDLLVRDYIPVLDESNIPCLFDKITQQCFYNQGTGEFLYVKPVELPEGYTQVKFIESSGTQYVDTGFKPSNNTRAVIDCDITYGSGWIKIFGVYDSATYFFSWWANGTTLNPNFGRDNKNITGITGRIILDANKNVWSANGSSATLTNTEFTHTSNAYLFSVNGGGTYDHATMKLYSCKIYDNGELVRDFVPCTNASGTAGLYDLVEGKFYTNTGTGMFSIGEIVSNTLDDVYIETWKNGQGAYVKTVNHYTSIPYIESTGTQWIDTEFKANQNTRVVIDCKATTINTGGSFPFGARENLSSKAYAFALVPTQVFYNYGTVYEFRDFKNTYSRMTIDANKNNVTVTANGETVTYALPAATFTTVTNIAICAYYEGSSITTTAKWNGLIYSCKIYDNEILIRDFIPVLDSNNIPCLYDKVTKRCFYNQGTGNFLYVKQVELPEEYTQVEYIESSGTQYVDTGFKPNQNTKIICDVKPTASANYLTVYGVRASGGTNACFVCYKTYSGMRVNIGNYSTDGSQITLNGTGGRVRIVQDGKTITVYPEETSFTASTSDFQSEYPLIINALSTSGKISDYGKIQYYSFKIYDNEVLVRDFIPCINSSGIAGLYDLISNVFYTNSGTGTFITGSEVLKTPQIETIKWTLAKEVYVKTMEDLTVLDYIESDGASYIDTEFKPNQDTRVVCDFQFSNTTSIQYLFCARGASYTNRFGLLLHSGGYFRCDYNASNLSFSTSMNLGNRYIVDFNKGNCVIGSESVTHNIATFSSSYNMYLFAGNTGGAVRENASVKIYSCKIYDNDILIRDYVPVLDSQSIPCLYDKVTNKLFYNQGTGSFVVGYKTEFEPETELLFLESNGTQYINTGIGSDHHAVIDAQFVINGKENLMGQTPNAGYYFGINSNGYIENGTSVAFSYLGTERNIITVIGSGTTQKVTVKDETLTATRSITVSETFKLLGGISGYPCIAKLYGCKFYDNGTLIRDYIPKTDVNGIPCLYDKVSKTYFYNQGTGTFSAVAKTNKIQRPYWKQVI